MKQIKITLLLVIVCLVSTVFSQSIFADELRKGTVRLVMDNKETAACEDELVCNGHRYLPADYLVAGMMAGTDFDFNAIVTDYAIGSVSYELTPYGYVSFWVGSTKVRLGMSDYGDGKDGHLIYPAAMYDDIMYVSIEDIADVLDCNYSFDEYKNTIYLY